ncbi:MAG: hypothetical protein ACK4G2_08940 [Novosphingobium sp.]
MTGAFRILAPLAVLQMIAPAPAAAAGRTIMLAACGGNGASIPVRLPARDDPGQNLPCCKVCHISMRKRSAADSCCANGEEGEDDGHGG